MVGKRIAALLLAMGMVVTAAAGCSKSESDTTVNNDTKTDTTVTENDTNASDSDDSDDEDMENITVALLSLIHIQQQYFFVSASLQRAVQKYKEKHDDIKKLYEKVVFQMNDTHPTVAVPELMRILMDEEGLTWEDAWDVTTKCCAYTCLLYTSGCTCKDSCH